MNENSREEKLKYIFSSYPKAKVLFVTSDNQMFFEESHAQPHAKTLEDQDIVKENRADYIAKAEPTAPAADQADQELEALREKHNLLFGTYPNKMAKASTILEKITKEEQRVADLAAKEAEKKGEGDPPKEEDPSKEEQDN